MGLFYRLAKCRPVKRLQHWLQVPSKTKRGANTTHETKAFHKISRYKSPYLCICQPQDGLTATYPSKTMPHSQRKANKFQPLIHLCISAAMTERAYLSHGHICLLTNSANRTKICQYIDIWGVSAHVVHRRTMGSILSGEITSKQPSE